VTLITVFFCWQF